MITFVSRKLLPGLFFVIFHMLFSPSPQIYKSNSMLEVSMRHSHSFPSAKSCKNSWTSSASKYVSLRDMMPHGRSFTFSGTVDRNQGRLAQMKKKSASFSSPPMIVKRSASEKILALAVWEHFLEDLKRPLSNCLNLIHQKFIVKISQTIGKVFAAILDF